MPCLHLALRAPGLIPTCGQYWTTGVQTAPRRECCRSEVHKPYQALSTSQGQGAALTRFGLNQETQQMKSKPSTTRDTSASRPLMCNNERSQSWPSCLKSSHATHTQSVSMRTKLVEKVAEENAVPMQAGRVARHTSNLCTVQNR